MNGVCVQMKGWIDIKRLDGVARLEFDYDLADVSRTVAKIYKFKRFLAVLF